MRSFAYAAAGALLLLPTLVVSAEGGGLTGPGSSQEAAGYSCDPTQCKLPDCACASTSIPGGLKPEDTPQFVVFTADDAVQTYTIAAIRSLIGDLKNPNGCPPRSTYFVSLNYTDFSLVTDWYVEGNEIADHTMTHQETQLAGADEINGNMIALNALSGIPFSDIKGFRAPFLNYSAEMLTLLHDSGFTYDSSATASIPVNSTGTDAFWPYTLDNGLANDCLTFPNICKGKPALKGFWEIPMYAIFDQNGGAGPHLMDPWLEGSTTDVLSWMKNTFNAHYTGNRQPFGLYTHPIHLATGYPGVTDPTAMIAMVKSFVDWAHSQPNVWIVSNEQLLQWVRNPVPVSQMNTLSSFQCNTPVVKEKICNGMPDNEAGLLALCPFSDAPFHTCYGCPATHPSPSDPNPSQPAVSGAVRARLPSNCSTAFWDPIGAKCLCQDAACQFTDQTGPINQNGSSSGSGSSSSAASSASSTNTPFSGGGSGNGAAGSFGLPGGAQIALVVGFMGVVMGAFTTLG